jgi:hypothetical protein
VSASVPTVVLVRADWVEPTWRAQAARESLRRLSRRALARAAALAGAPAGPWTKDERGAPLPLGTWRWSVSHGGGFAAAALGRVAHLGIDVEPALRQPSPNVCARLAGLGVVARAPSEWLAAWCRVEAALKACGLGLSSIASVRVEGPLVAVGATRLMTRLFETDGALLAVAGGGVCALEQPLSLRASEVAA